MHEFFETLFALAATANSTRETCRPAAPRETILA
jgi:hypothetical protein